jgi:hypothetical protein
MKVGQCRPACGHGLISWRQETDVSDVLSRVTVLSYVPVLSDLNGNSHVFAACVQPVTSRKTMAVSVEGKSNFLRSLFLQFYIYSNK